MIGAPGYPGFPVTLARAGADEEGRGDPGADPDLDQPRPEPAGHEPPRLPPEVDLVLDDLRRAGRITGSVVLPA